VCILLAIRRSRNAGELWVAANRDEKLDRPWQAPLLLTAAPPVFGGRDLVGGGSWLAANLEAGFLVGVTNARRGAPPGERSRGRLVLELAMERSTAEAMAMLSELDLGRYGDFNLLLADAQESWLATNAPEPRIEPGEGSVVAIGNDPLSEPGGRVLAAAERGRALARSRGGRLADALRELLADHEGADPLCRHGELYGTVCSSIVAIGRGAVSRYLFAPGAPCTTPFQRLELAGFGPTVH
jgi:uncharacterized protein with NRDE domain